MARRFSLFRRSEPEQPTDAPDDQATGFGFVTYAAEDTPAPGDPDQPVIIGSLPNPPDATDGTDVAVEELTIAHEGFQPAESQTEIFGFTHEVQSPRDAASTMANLTPGSSISDLQPPDSTPEPEDALPDNLDLLD